MMAVQSKSLWGLVALLLAVAFLRSLAPERTESAVRGLAKVSSFPSSISEDTQKDLDEIRQELERERAALARWKDELSAESERIASIATAPGTNFQPGVEEHAKTADETGLASAESDPDTFTDGSKRANDGGVGETSPRQRISEEGERNAGKQEVHTNFEQGDMEAIEHVHLTGEACPTIVIPQSAKAGMGTQMEHMWSSLSLTLAIRNACMVLPPVAADDGNENYRSVPFQQIFDLSELKNTGMRFVPLKACQAHGVSIVFDDSGAESAIVKNFAAFVQESHPKLASESTLVHADSQGYRFQNATEVQGDITVSGKYVLSKLPGDGGRQCVGIGRMRSEVTYNPDVIEHTKHAPSISDYVSKRFPHATETMFVKLRWNRAHCDKIRTEDGTVCIFGDNIVAGDAYVQSILYAARRTGAQHIYIATPAHTPDDVSEYLTNNMALEGPVLLDVDGDSFTANIIERELAIRSKVFVPDGGAWGDSVQVLRKVLVPDIYDDSINSMRLIQQWQEAGQPRDLEDPATGDVTQEANNFQGESKVMGEGSRAVQADGEPDHKATDVQGLEAKAPQVQTGDNNQGHKAKAPQVQTGDNNQGQKAKAPQVSTVKVTDQRHTTAAAVSSTGVDQERRPHKYDPPVGYTPDDDSDEELQNAVAPGPAPTETGDEVGNYSRQSTDAKAAVSSGDVTISATSTRTPSSGQDSSPDGAHHANGTDTKGASEADGKAPGVSKGAQQPGSGKA